MLTELEKNIVRELQRGLPLTERPFLEIAGRLNITEDDLVERVKNLVERGIIRRFGAAVRHQDLGFVSNAMVVWKVDEADIERAGRLFSGNSHVSHCYQRKTAEDWQYNLYTVVHGKTDEECRRIAGKMSELSGLKDYMVIFSTRELKKESMKYFCE
ncbi:MAG: Lrp/AsnC family transcriptional regulator [Bacillota bacterium]